MMLFRLRIGGYRGGGSKLAKCLALIMFAAVLNCGEKFAVAQSDSAPSSEAIQSRAKEAVGERAWYDPASDQLLPLTVKSKTDDTIHRDSRWLPKPKKIRQRAPGSGATGSGGSGRAFWGSLGSSLSSANLFAWGVLVLLVIVLVALLVYAYSRIDQQPDFAAQTKKSLLDDMDDEELAERIEQLPEELRQQITDLRGAARHWMQEGQFDRAIILLFGHQLLLLDRHQIIRLSRGKTNRQYLNEARSHTDVRSILRNTVDAFESSYFGRHPLSSERFAILWDENEHLEKRLAQHHEAVA